MQLTRAPQKVGVEAGTAREKVEADMARRASMNGIGDIREITSAIYSDFSLESVDLSLEAESWMLLPRCVLPRESITGIGSVNPRHHPLRKHERQKLK
nr:hypothetical protein CFP56_11112 [Quercus suber]